MDDGEVALLLVHGEQREHGQVGLVQDHSVLNLKQTCFNFVNIFELCHLSILRGELSAELSVLVLQHLGQPQVPGGLLLQKWRQPRVKLVQSLVMNLATWSIMNRYNY